MIFGTNPIRIFVINFLVVCDNTLVNPLESFYLIISEITDYGVQLPVRIVPDASQDLL